MLGSYIILRFILLGAMENPEPRYTVQFFPILIVAAAAALTGSRPVRVLNSDKRSAPDFKSKLLYPRYLR